MATPTYESLFATLNQRELTVIAYRFGLTGGDELTLEEVGSILGVTRESIRQTEGKALRKLRARAAKLRVKFSDFFA